MTDADADLAYWLSKWASWMRWNASELPQGAPCIASGFEHTPSNYAVSESDSQDYWECHQVPAVIAALDAAIDSLQADQRRAIWWVYGLTRVEPPRSSNAFSEAFSALRVLVLRRVAIA